MTEQKVNPAGWIQRRGAKAHRLGGVTGISALGRRREDKWVTEDFLFWPPRKLSKKRCLATIQKGKCKRRFFISIGTRKTTTQTFTRGVREASSGHIPYDGQIGCGYQTDYSICLKTGNDDVGGLGNIQSSGARDCQGARKAGIGTNILIKRPTQGIRQSDGVRRSARNLPNWIGDNRLIIREVSHDMSRHPGLSNGHVRRRSLRSSLSRANHGPIRRETAKAQIPSTQVTGERPAKPARTDMVRNRECPEWDSFQRKRNGEERYLRRAFVESRCAVINGTHGSERKEGVRCCEAASLPTQ